MADTKARNATPLVLSLVPRKIWKNHQIVRATNSYGQWAADSAKSADGTFVDLNEIVSRRYETLGPEKVNDLFGDDHTHTNPAGAELNAECVIAGLKALKDAPLNQYLTAKGAAVTPFEPTRTKSPK
jgi:lysophospholipase L1-like esterase